jgi:hypothetical protein
MLTQNRYKGDNRMEKAVIYLTQYERHLLYYLNITEGIVGHSIEVSEDTLSNMLYLLWVKDVRNIDSLRNKLQQAGNNIFGW